MAGSNLEVDAAKLRQLAETIDNVQTSLRESCYGANSQLQQ